MFTSVASAVPQPATGEIRAWMHAPVITVHVDTPLGDAVALMHEQHVRHLPVVDGEGKLCGIITDGDARSADSMRTTGSDLLAIAATLRQKKARDVMTARPLVVRAETSLSEAARLMRDYKISGLPVVDDKHTVAGIITETDLLSALIAHLECPPAVN